MSKFLQMLIEENNEKRKKSKNSTRKVESRNSSKPN
jgi:hypothetical protein